MRPMFHNAQSGFNMAHKILRLPEVKSLTGASRSTVYLRVQQGLFTKPISLGLRSVGWPAHEIDAINLARIAGKSNSEIQTLVKRLEAARAPLFETV